MQRFSTIRRGGCAKYALLSVVLLGLVMALAFWYIRPLRMKRISGIREWFRDPTAHQAWQVHIGERCGEAPMIIPTTGYIGVGWGDGFSPFYQHTGYDIFSPDGADNVTPIVAAYDGYLTREANWRSAVIIRHPDFPTPVDGVDLVDGEQIWTYYTHMASTDGETSYVAAEFPQGTREKFVEAGTILGYQGTWSGNPTSPTGLHLHFSVVTSTPDGAYANETTIRNTYDPALFLGLEADEDGILSCRSGNS
ncbi:MAG: M23 family metallopeptidase [Ardenticatenaceae bacterium]